MTQRQIPGFLIGGSLILAVLFMVVAQFSAPPNIGFKDSASILAIITAAAIGIERVIEAFWTGIGLTAGAWWPLDTITKQINEKVTALEELMEPYYQQARAAVDNVAKTAEWTREEIAAAKAEIDQLQRRSKASREQLKELAPDSQRVQLIAASAFEVVSYLQKRFPQHLQADAALVTQSISGLTDFVATFKDHPGRRLISIYAGAFIGMVLAGVLGLDLIQAALQIQPVGDRSSGLLPHLGVALTGFIIGLGSNPTHEVIRAIQEYKKSRKAANDPAPIFGDGSAAGLALAAPAPEREIPVELTGQPNRFTTPRT